MDACKAFIPVMLDAVPAVPVFHTVAPAEAAALAISRQVIGIEVAHTMRKLLIFGPLFLAFLPTAWAQSHKQETNLQNAKTTTAAERENYDPLLDLPPLPHNTVTLIGGTVTSLDEVMNRMQVQPFGSNRKMTVAFDTRTHFFRDGQPISYRDIRQGQRIYLDTMLNGSKVFAKQIWIQTSVESGVGRGQIIDFDAARGVLTVRDELSNQPLKMRITSSTVIRKGEQQGSATDLMEGALVGLRFGPQRELQQITVLAKPGSSFTFAGRITYLDLSRKLIAIDNRSDRNKYDISIDAIAPSIVRQLHEGMDVNVSAVFDGNQYAARQIEFQESNSAQQ
jgi:hypothetical protein